MKPPFITSLVFALGFATICFSRDKPKVWVSGTLGASTEFYNFSSTDSTLMPRRPDFNYRLFFNPVFHFGKKISLPLSLMATKRFSNVYMPLPDYSNSLRSLTNPNNAIGLNPTFGWVTFHIDPNI